MKYLIALLLAVAFSAHADQAPPGAIDKMVAQSEFYMNCGLCQVQRDTRVYTTETITETIAGKGRFTYLQSDYSYIREAGNEIDPVTGLYVMSQRIKDACTLNWSGGACWVARLKWKQEWPTGQCMTPDGKVYTARQQ